jgi:hypothetical protein
MANIGEDTRTSDQLDRAFSAFAHAMACTAPDWLADFSKILGRDPCRMDFPSLSNHTSNIGRARLLARTLPDALFAMRVALLRELKAQLPKHGLGGYPIAVQAVLSPRHSLPCDRALEQGIALLISRKQLLHSAVLQLVLERYLGKQLAATCVHVHPDRGKRFGFMCGVVGWRWTTLPSRAKAPPGEFEAVLRWFWGGLDAPALVDLAPLGPTATGLMMGRTNGYYMDNSQKCCVRCQMPWAAEANVCTDLSCRQLRVRPAIIQAIDVYIDPDTERRVAAYDPVTQDAIRHLITRHTLDMRQLASRVS